MIDINNLGFVYNYKQQNPYVALKNVSFTINENDFVAIIGHTGSGKSTLIQNLNALLVPTSGSVTYKDFAIAPKCKIKNIKQLRKEIGIVFQFPEYQLFEETVSKDILFGPKNFNMSEEKLKDLDSKVLKLVGLDDSFKEKSPFELSGGEKRRVAIAGVLSFDPKVLIVDEPTAGLDPQSATKMMELYYKLYKEYNKTIILVTHQMDDVLKYANTVIALKQGEVLFNGKPLTLFNNQKLVDELGIDVPDVILMSNLLKKKYPLLATSKIKDIPSLCLQLKAVREHE